MSLEIWAAPVSVVAAVYMYVRCNKYKAQASAARFGQNLAVQNRLDAEYKRDELYRELSILRGRHSELMIERDNWKRRASGNG